MLENRLTTEPLTPLEELIVLPETSCLVRRGLAAPSQEPHTTFGPSGFEVSKTFNIIEVS